MTMRLVAGCALLVLGLSVLQVAVDGASFRPPDRREWRAPTHHQAAARLLRRNTNGIPLDGPAAPVPGLGGPVAAPESPAAPSTLLPGVFVPPRV